MLTVPVALASPAGSSSSKTERHFGRDEGAWLPSRAQLAVALALWRMPRTPEPSAGLVEARTPQDVHRQLLGRTAKSAKVRFSRARQAAKGRTGTVERANRLPSVRFGLCSGLCSGPATRAKIANTFARIAQELKAEDPQQRVDSSRILRRRPPSVSRIAPTIAAAVRG
jgi:hypothetical protein